MTNTSDSFNPRFILHIINYQIFFSFDCYTKKKKDSDAPPFNFQGMLRKTNHQRASMKRVTSADGVALVPNGNVVYRSNERNSSRIDFDFDVNDNVHPPPVAPRKLAAPIPSERKAVSFGERSNTFESIGTYVQEEIHPGILLEGYAVEL